MKNEKKSEGCGKKAIKKNLIVPTIEIGEELCLLYYHSGHSNGYLWTPILCGPKTLDIVY